MKRFVSILILFVFCSFSVRATADDMRAEITVPTDVATLSEAYAQIAPQGTIQLLRGKHEVPETITITKNVTIIGDVKHPEYVLLEGGVNSVFDVQSGFAEIAGVTIRNEGKEYENDETKEEYRNYAAVRVTTLLCAFHDCIFTSRFRMGFLVDAHGSDPKVTNCIAKNCGSEGFTIKSGASGTFRDCTASRNTHSGMWVNGEESNPTVENCQFIDGKGAGITVSDKASGTFLDCTVSGNAHEGMALYGARPTVERCKFMDGRNCGITITGSGLLFGVYTMNSAGTFRDCTISGNAGSGMDVSAYENDPTVEGCTFTKNKQNGVCVSWSAGGTFRKNLFLENEKAAWSIEKGCKVIREENTPNE